MMEDIWQTLQDLRLAGHFNINERFILLISNVGINVTVVATR